MDTTTLRDLVQNSDKLFFANLYTDESQDPIEFLESLSVRSMWGLNEGSLDQSLAQIVVSSTNLRSFLNTAVRMQHCTKKEDSNCIVDVSIFFF